MFEPVFTLPIAWQGPMYLAAAVSLLFSILSILVAYLVLKAAIRDGIREAMRGAKERPVEQVKPVAPDGYKWTLVRDEPTTKPMGFSSDFRAER